MDIILPQVQAVLTTTPGRWLSLTEALSPDLLNRPPAAGQWSAIECLQHMLDTEHLFGSRLQAFLAGQDFPAFNPDSEGSKAGALEPAQLAHEFSRLRSANLAVISKLTPPDLSRRVRHQELGAVTLNEMLNEWAAHDLNHTVQAERALMQPFIAECGPWAPYFADHAVRE